MDEWAVRIGDTGVASRDGIGWVQALDWPKEQHLRVMAAEAKRPSRILGTRAKSILNAENRIISSGLGMKDELRKGLIDALSSVTSEKAATQMVDDWLVLHMEVVRASAQRISALAK